MSPVQFTVGRSTRKFVRWCCSAPWCTATFDRLVEQAFECFRRFEWIGIGRVLPPNQVAITAHVGGEVIEAGELWLDLTAVRPGQFDHRRDAADPMMHAGQFVPLRRELGKPIVI